MATTWCLTFGGHKVYSPHWLSQCSFPAPRLVPFNSGGTACDMAQHVLFCPVGYGPMLPEIISQIWKDQLQNHFLFLGLRIKMWECRKVDVNLIEIKFQHFRFIVCFHDSKCKKHDSRFHRGTCEPASLTRHSVATCPLQTNMTMETHLFRQETNLQRSIIFHLLLVTGPIFSTQERQAIHPHQTSRPSPILAQPTRLNPGQTSRAT